MLTRIQDRTKKGIRCLRVAETIAPRARFCPKVDWWPSVPPECAAKPPDSGSPRNCRASRTVDVCPGATRRTS